MKYKAHFDGSSKGNPGPSQCGWIIFDDQGNEVKRHVQKSKEDRTNNIAEYMGLATLIQFLSMQNEIKDILIVGDSKLVINQVQGLWKCKSSNLMHLHLYCHATIKDLNEVEGFNIELKWVPREENKPADSLAQTGDL